jgi:hypothetical protein
LQTDDAYNRFGRFRFLLDALLSIIRTTMKHSISLMMLVVGISAAVQPDSHVYAATTGGATRADSATAANDGGIATEHDSRASEQQLLGLPRVPKDTNLSDPDDSSASVMHVALRRSATSSASTFTSTATKRGEVFANPFPASIYPGDTNGAVYQNPW